jgi:acetylornithine deacetylase/succinyl-diaminopimelate desuccinylase-like protein
MKRMLLLILIAFLPASALAQLNPAAQAGRKWRQAHEHEIVAEFATLLSVPNVSRDRENVQRNAELIARMMERRQIAAQLVTVPGASPVVFGEIRTPGATRTLVFYAHYDGQPLDPREWATPPFEPTLRDAPLEAGGKVIPFPAAGKLFNPEWRLYARSAADDKAPIVALFAAVDALRASGVALKSNIKFAFDGEEEAGSPNLERILSANKEKFAGDVWLICDGPLDQTRRQSVIFGARTVLALDLTVYGARVELHSGHYGNWAPNPAMALARLLSSMKAEDGRVLIDRFYDDVEPLGELERRAIAEAPNIDRQLMQDLWLGATEGAPKRLTELIAVPSLNIRGMASSKVGELASNVIPATATASIDIRLVKGMDARRTAATVIEHIRRQGFFVADSEPSAEVRRDHAKVARVTVGRGVAHAVRTPMDLPIAQEVVRTVESVRGDVVKLPTMGGSLPLENIERPLGTRTIVIPVGNHDNNQHTFNENLRIQNFWDAIELMAALLAM